MKENPETSWLENILYVVFKWAQSSSFLICASTSIKESMCFFFSPRLLCLLFDLNTWSMRYTVLIIHSRLRKGGAWVCGERLIIYLSDHADENEGKSLQFHICRVSPSSSLSDFFFSFLATRGFFFRSSLLVHIQVGISFSFPVKDDGLLSILVIATYAKRVGYNRSRWLGLQGTIKRDRLLFFWFFFLCLAF